MGTRAYCVTGTTLLAGTRVLLGHGTVGADCEGCARILTRTAQPQAVPILSLISTFLSRSFRSLFISSIAKRSILLPIYTVLFYVDTDIPLESENVGKSATYS
jgi:hypothetical protein